MDTDTGLETEIDKKVAKKTYTKVIGVATLKLLFYDIFLFVHLDFLTSLRWKQINCAVFFKAKKKLSIQ